MGVNLRKFVNPTFTRTVQLTLVRRLLDRHRAELTGLDFGLFDRDTAAARVAIQNFFAGPESNYPDGLVADLHRIAELGTRQGFEMLLQQARRMSVQLVVSAGGDAAREDPKQVALSAFLDYPWVFNAASDLLAFRVSSAIAEFVGTGAGVEVALDDRSKSAFDGAVAEMFEADLHGRFCRVGWYEDGSDVALVVTHGAPITTTPVIREGKEQILCYRPTEHARLLYSAADGRLKLGGVGKARRARLAAIFAETLLKRPGFFDGLEAQDLYTLAPIERDWPNFRFAHAFDPEIRRVRIVEVQADLVSLDLFGELSLVHGSITARDPHECALARLRESCPDIQFGSDSSWRLGQIVLRADMETGRPRPTPVIVKIRPKDVVTFKRQRFEGQIMEVLRRNGLCNERDADSTPVAAE